MLDLHCHILPGVDDGPDAIEQSLALARAAAADGVHTIVATPHLRADHPTVVPSELAGRCAELGSRFAREGIPVRLVPGGEVDLVWAHEAEADDLRLVTYGQRGTDLLLETPYGPLPPTFERLVAALVAQGLRVLLAHPERNPTFQRHPDRLEALVGDAVLVQLTAASLVQDPARSRSSRLARVLLDIGCAHVIASDAHGVGTFGRVALSEAVEAATWLAPARSRWMVTDAPAAVLAGERLPPSPA